jgi:phage replication O-like protein O
VANVQKENGFCPIANELMEALAYADLKAAEYRVLLYIIRLTYGWNRKKTILPAEQIAAGCALSANTVHLTIRSLRARNIIQTEGDNHHPKTYSIQKDYEKWQGLSLQVYTQKSRPTEIDSGKVYTQKSRPVAHKVYTQTDAKSIPGEIDPLPYSKDSKDNKDRGPTTESTEITGAEWAKTNLSDPMNPWYIAAQKFRRAFPGQRGSTTPWVAAKLHELYADVCTPAEVEARVALLQVEGVTDCKPWDVFKQGGNDGGSPGSISQYAAYVQRQNDERPAALDDVSLMRAIEEVERN